LEWRDRLVPGRAVKRSRHSDKISLVNSVHVLYAVWTRHCVCMRHCISARILCFNHATVVIELLCCIKLIVQSRHVLAHVHMNGYAIDT